MFDIPCINTVAFGVLVLKCDEYESKQENKIRGDIDIVYCVLEDSVREQPEIPHSTSDTSSVRWERGDS